VAQVKCVSKCGVKAESPKATLKNVFFREVNSQRPGARGGGQEGGKRMRIKENVREKCLHI